MKTKTQYRIRNWPQYNAALRERGSLTLWVDEEALAAWRYTGPKQRGAQYVYADAAIKCVLTLRAVYHLALRATEGLARSLLGLLQVALPVPSYSTLSRRAAAVAVALGARPRAGPLHLVIDSSGFKVYGEGEWKVRLHGWSKRRTWRKLHLAVDEATGEIVAAVASTAGVSDDDALPDLLAGVPGAIGQVSADGAYDKRRCYEAIEERGAQAAIPPRRDAKIWQHGNCAPLLPSTGMRTCGRSVAKAGGAGSRSRDTIDAAWQKPPSSAARRSLARRCRPGTSATRRRNSSLRRRR